MQRISWILLAMGFGLCVSAQEKEYQLVWSDEFDVEGKPSTEWSYESGFVRNEELQWYQSENAYVKDGCLVIEGNASTIPITRLAAAIGARIVNSFITRRVR